MTTTGYAPGAVGADTSMVNDEVKGTSSVVSTAPSALRVVAPVATIEVVVVVGTVVVGATDGGVDAGADGAAEMLVDGAAAALVGMLSVVVGLAAQAATTSTHEKASERARILMTGRVYGPVRRIRRGGPRVQRLLHGR
jgi:hypothetical protein